MSAPLFCRNTHDPESGEFKGDSCFRDCEETRPDGDGKLIMHLIDEDWWSLPMIVEAVHSYATQWPEDVDPPEKWTNTRIWEALCCAVWSGVIEVRDEDELTAE